MRCVGFQGATTSQVGKDQTWRTDIRKIVQDCPCIYISRNGSENHLLESDLGDQLRFYASIGIGFPFREAVAVPMRTVGRAS